MNLNNLLKKEGISNIKALSPTQVTTISRDIAIKLCLAFPEHSLDRKFLYDSFCSLNMYTCTMPKDSSGAKYISHSNSIYFNEELNFVDLPEVAMHECIHFLQEIRLSNKSNCIGLSSYNFGIALNEAAVQLMASEANMSQVTEEKYFDISFKTISPIYYPLECTLVSQMVSFTGTYPLYTSVLNSNDIFKNTFINKFNEKIYNKIVHKLDLLLNLENELNDYIFELENTEKIHSIKQLNMIITEKKSDITKLFFNIQNYIIKNCFSCTFNSINTAEDLKNFKYSLYNFKNLIGTTNDYTFYNDFYCDLMNACENKKEELLKYGEISLFKQECTALTLVQKSSDGFNIINILLKKIKKLLKLNKETINDYNN